MTTLVSSRPAHGTAASLAGATQDEVRRHNLASILRLLHREGPASRSTLVTRTGLNRSTVGTLTTELAGAGLVRESVPAGRGVGRPSIVVEPVITSVYVVALDLRVERTVAATVSLGGGMLTRVERRHGTGPRALGGTLKQAERLLAELVAAAPPGARLVGVGVAVPGLVRHQDGVVRIAPNLGWVDVPVAARLSAGSGAPHVVVGNDADFGALAEFVRGAARGVPNVLYVSGEVGTGGGVILDGRPMTGAGGYGGEIGHMVVNPRGHACHCGSRGCWETEVGEPAVIAAAGLDPEHDDIAAVVAAWHAGDREARGGLRRVGRWLGLGLANLVNLFNPEIVVLGGMLSDIYPLVEPEVQAAMAAALSAPREQVRVVPPALGRDSALVGAAEAAFAALLDDPLGVLAAAGER